MNSQDNRCLDPAAEVPSRFEMRRGFRRWLTATLDRGLDWLDRARSRRQLARLDDRQLRDIGVSRTDADREAAKPFWKA